MPYQLRLGPSASAAGVSDEKADKLISALDTLKCLMSDPEIRGALPNLPFDIHEMLNPGINDEDEDEEARAKAGKAAGSKARKDELPKAVIPVPPVPKDEEPPKEPEPAKTETPDVPEALVNSSTHRKEHARLTRRVASLDPEKFPEIHRMWGGNRQDRITFLFAFFWRSTTSIT